MTRCNLGRNFRRSERWYNDEQYKKKIQEQLKQYYQKNKKKVLECKRKYTKMLNEFKNQHCMLCGKLLYHEVKGDYCRECLISNLELKNEKK